MPQNADPWNHTLIVKEVDHMLKQRLNKQKSFVTENLLHLMYEKKETEFLLAYFFLGLNACVLKEGTPNKILTIQANNFNF